LQLKEVDKLNDNNKRLLLTELRKADGTQQDVAIKFGISRAYLGMIESGVRNPTVKLMAKIEKHFGIPANKLFPDLFFEIKCNKTKQNKSA
jgi:transcriptional regulator with XRE-family HTH domain